VAVPQALSAILDAEVGSSNGMIIVRSGGTWTSLASPSDATKYLSGTAVPSYTVPSATGGAGWATALDLDFSAQSNQTLGSDTTFTIGGYTWTKASSTNDNVAMTVINGSGLVIQPKSTGSYNGTTRTAPNLYIDLASIIPSYYIDMPIRIWFYISSHNMAANADAAGVFMDNLGTATTICQQVIDQGFNATGRFLASASALISASLTFQTIVPAALSGVNAVMVVNGSNGRLVGNTDTFYSAIGGGNAWPSTATIIPFCRSTFASGTLAEANNIVTGLPMKIGIFAQRGGSATALSVTVQKIRIDYKVT
jgi:hypothetical protein